MDDANQRQADNMPPEPPQQRPDLHRSVSGSTKVSLRSHSSSFEADDERSSSSGRDHHIMGPDAQSSRREPESYVGEDTRLTSKKELSGWYAYGFAAEVFVICGMGSFIPITLEQLARENGVLLSDRTTPCVPSVKASLAAGLLSRMTTAAVKDTGQCIVHVLGMEINTASFAMYIFSISVFIQSVLVISISCAADHGAYRKRLLLGFAFTGAIATMLFLAAAPSIYIFGGVLAIVSNTCFGASFVLLNSFLPLLVRHHPKAQFRDLDFSPETQDDAETGDSSLADSTAALLPPSVEEVPQEVISDENTTSIELQLSTQISAKGIGIGYSAGLFVQCLGIVVLVLMKSSTFSLRLVLFIVGAWWFFFTIPAALWLRPRPGPPLPKTTSKGTARTWLGYIAHSWLSLFRTIRLARRLTDILLFLLAWFLLSDAIATVSGTAILYAKTTLHMKAPNLALISVLGTMSGILGAVVWPILSRSLALNPINTILACIFLFEFIPLYGLLGYLPFIKTWGFLGLQQPWEMYPLGMLYGLVLGGLSSYCRSLYGELIPPGSEAAFYALYAITDKGSSIFGPAIVGMIVDRTGEIRPAFWFLAVLVGLPAPILYFVDVARGKEEGRRLAETIEGFRIGEDGNANGSVNANSNSEDGEGEEAGLLRGGDEHEE